MWNRQLDVSVWNSGEMFGTEFKFRNLATKMVFIAMKVGEIMRMSIEREEDKGPLS